MSKSKYYTIIKNDKNNNNNNNNNKDEIEYKLNTKDTTITRH